MEFSDSKLNRDLHKIYMRNFREQQDFNRYMYMYGLFIQNYKLQIQLNQQLNQQSNPSINQQLNVVPYQSFPVVKQLNLHPYSNQFVRQPNQQTEKIQYMQTLNDSVDSNIKNAVLIVQIPNGDIIIVRNSKTKEWMLPAGSLNSGETPFNGALREFKEETSFNLDTSKLNLPIKYYDIKHSNNSKTRIIKVNTSQEFGTYDKTNVYQNETDDLEYISISKIKSHVSKLNYFNSRNLQTFTELFHISFM
jgi:8-oxo-dGTP pyrophosphatase MutT (NUDIX family)